MGHSAMSVRKPAGRRGLPFDAGWESRKLIAEIDEDQHRKAVQFWDKPTVMTVSGVSRGEQRGIYAQRKRDAARANGYTVLEIPWERRPRPNQRDRNSDIGSLRQLCELAGVDLRLNSSKGEPSGGFRRGFGPL